MHARGFVLGEAEDVDLSFLIESDKDQVVLKQLDHADIRHTPTEEALRLCCPHLEGLGRA